MEYKGYTIQKDFCEYRGVRWMFYKTEEGIDHQAEQDGEDMVYCGNCRWADSIEEAKDEIDDTL
jgi:hypothetical protein